MPEQDRLKWNSKFGSRDMVPGEPEPFLMEHHQKLRGGVVMDLACGDGRNSLFLAREGHQTIGVDISDVGLERLAEFAAQRELSLEVFAMDLEESVQPDSLPPFQNVVISHYKPVSALWELLVERLPRGGLVIISTFNLRQHEATGFSKKFCLREREYFDLHPHLQVEHYESREDQGKFTDGYILKKV